MNKKHIYLFMFIGAIGCSAYAGSQSMPWPQTTSPPVKQADSTKEALAQARQLGTSYLNDRLKLATWFTRTDINYTIQDDYKPIGSVETIQPLYFNTWHTVFWQGRIGYSGSETTGNLGLGYRYLTDRRQFMWGVNSFYDQNLTRTHRRIGVGGEAFTPYLAFRVNYYEGVSGTRTVSSYNELALDGYDGSIETPVPWVPWARFKAEGYHWDGVTSANVNGGSASFRIFPTKHLEVDVGVAHDNNQGTQAFLQLDYYLGAPAFIQYTAMSSGFSKGFTALNLEELRLQKVRRYNNITVERTTTTGSGGIIIARGT